MPAPAPPVFLEECRRKGIKLSLRDGNLIATGKPPANPEKFAAFLRSKKPELVELLSETPIKAAPIEVLPTPLVAGEAVEGSNFRSLELQTGDLYPAGDRRQEVLSWALSEARRGLLPELVESLSLPSGQVVQPGHASDWLRTRYDVALRLRLVLSGDAPAAFQIVREDLRFLAVAAAHAWHCLYLLTDEAEGSPLCQRLLSARNKEN